MNTVDDLPRTFRILREDAMDIRHSPFGSVGTLLRRDGIEAVWVKKEREEIDQDWFSQSVIDLIVVVQGTLRVEFERADVPPCTLEVGDLLILPPETQCRAYRWPRDAGQAAVFLAVYPAM